ncbi:MAG: hypothetical protein N4A74_03025 [Carboxylicivirga sp.]|jgi:D-alanyl-lipoteichoic acid acyltransferase DltB (MBOAT superfamily)|nr:hypothetical protein [Carboxylicivirga sp.]
MIFNSWEFIILFALVFVSYNLAKHKAQKWILLIGSAIFIGFSHIGFLVLAALSTLITFKGAHWINKKEDEKHRSFAFKSLLVVQILLLIGFKYFGFLEANLSYLLSLLGHQNQWTAIHIFVPLGISFYTFQAISYLIEVYWEEIETEENLLDFSIYMLFFMKFLSGPIERADSFLPQLKKSKTFNYDNTISGLKLIGIGLFKKLMIADRLAPVLNDLFASVQDYSGAQLLVGTILYPIQLYADFSGYTDIAIGGALILGFQLSPNFNRPFIAQTITDFWRRWHMSLSFWVRDYLYEPIAMNRRSWGKWGIAYALIVTFILLGLWHGGSWSFIIYGAIQGLVITYEMLSEKQRSSLLSKLPSGLAKTYGILRTFLIFSISLLFFKIENIADVGHVLSHAFDGVDSSLKELNLGIKDHNLIMCLSSIVLVFFYEYAESKWDIKQWFNKKPTAVRWAFYYLMLILVFCNGALGNTDFIYLQF